MFLLTGKQGGKAPKGFPAYFNVEENKLYVFRCVMKARDAIYCDFVLKNMILFVMMKKIMLEVCQ